MSHIADPVPKWKKGNWWIIETSVVEDISEIRHGPEKLGLVSYRHIYEVVGEENVDGQETWIIDIKATEIPPDVPNDHGDNYLWRLYLRKADLSIKRFMMNVRSGNYLVSNQEIVEQAIDFEMGNPVVIDHVPVRTPLDIPKLPFGGEFPRFLSEEEKELQFLDEESEQEFVQYIVAVQEEVDGEPTMVLHVTLYNENIGIRTQKWVPGLPWWQEWRYATNDRFTDGMWYARLIEWGSADDKKPNE